MNPTQPSSNPNLLQVQGSANHNVSGASLSFDDVGSHHSGFGGIGFNGESSQGHIVIISLSLALNIVTLLMFLYCKSALGNGSKHWDRLKRYTRKMCVIHLVFSVPMMYCYGVFWHCDYTTLKLFAFSEVECWSPSNSGLASISMLGALMTFIITLISSLVLVDINPASKGIFVSFTPFFFASLVASNTLFAFLQQAIPPYIYYAVPSLFIVKQLLLCVALVQRYPFFRRVENSVMFGVLVGSGMWAVANLVVFSVNSNVPSIDLETSGLAIMGVGFLLPITGIVLGFVGIEIATRVIVSKVKHDLDNLMSSPQGELEEMKYSHLFIQWAMKDHSLAEYVRYLINEVSSTKVDLSFIDLITSACYMHYLVEDFQTSALLLLKRSEEMFDSVWFIDRLELQIRKREITSHIHAESAEVSEYLTKVVAKQDTILILQRSFWKIVLSEEISELAMEQAGRKIWSTL
ncbi:predicted protein [Naegleria gruberi]|uniref:Predicted protein n=1 Tax=Naegleria gruberi TaxID=5762 RepID=D2VF54_NAEGR|nr:uncharacterized protein NAEGRDRAFT_49033 [Naegleria gruberi]EFC44624.1 predicted protein [Naegleria gruberi]|eukprot:XP_002677368.1 predicted protein [Naegleria gruberi strain NEG-M]